MPVPEAASQVCQWIAIMDAATWNRAGGHPSRHYRTPRCQSRVPAAGLRAILAISNVPAFYLLASPDSAALLLSCPVYVCPDRPTYTSCILQSPKGISLYRLSFAQPATRLQHLSPLTMSFLSPNRLRAKIAPHLALRVPFKAGIYEN